ncbi:MAG: type II secretion system protein [Patescibacteria group bacterium]
MPEDRKTKKGFTMVEMLVVISIVGILVTLIIVDFRRGKMNDDLRHSAISLSEAFRQVQNLAQSGRESASAEERRGFGIFLNPGVDPDKYWVFDDQNADHFYNVSDDKLIEEKEVTFPDRVIIEKVESTNFFEISQGVALVFVLLEPKPYVCVTAPCGGNIGDDLTVTLKHTTTEATRKVQVNGFTGQVEVSAVSE